VDGAVIAKSFARIHYANLINFGILPLTFADPSDLDRIEQGDLVSIEGLVAAVGSAPAVVAVNRTKTLEIRLKISLTARQRSIVIAGGLLNYTRRSGLTS
jgi:aconitate hydratase